jgi:hypothetical protein
LTDSDYATSGPLLGLFMRRRGWSAARLAEIAGGVSASSVRAYTTDQSTPRPSQALAVANALGPQDGRRMLEGWGYTDLAEGFSQDRQRAASSPEGRASAVTETGGNRIEYLGESLSDAGLALVRATLNWVQSMEVANRDRKGI